MLTRVIVAGVFSVLIAGTAAYAQGPQGCCACTGFGGVPSNTGCSNDFTFCTNGTSETGCEGSGGTFMSFTAGLVCQGNVDSGRCVAAASAPAVSAGVLAMLAMALAFLGYRTVIKRRALR